MVGAITSQQNGPSAALDHTPETQIQCLECGKLCMSAAALQGHMTRSHAKRKIARWYASGCVCCVCMYDFMCRPKLLRHLSKKSSKCLTIMQQYTDPLLDSVVAELDLEDLNYMKANVAKGYPKYYHPMPVRRSIGPCQLFH